MFWSRSDIMKPERLEAVRRIMRMSGQVEAEKRLASEALSDAKWAPLGQPSRDTWSSTSYSFILTCLPSYYSGMTVSTLCMICEVPSFASGSYSASLRVAQVSDAFQKNIDIRVS